MLHFVLYFLSMAYYLYEQECIPVGCVPAARGPYARVCFPRGGGVSGLGGGGSGPRGVGMSALGVGGWVSGLGGVCSGVCVWSGGRVVASQHALRQTPSPPVNRMNDTQV